MSVTEDNDLLLRQVHTHFRIVMSQQRKIILTINTIPQFCFHGRLRPHPWPLKAPSTWERKKKKPPQTGCVLDPFRGLRRFLAAFSRSLVHRWRGVTSSDSASGKVKKIRKLGGGEKVKRIVHCGWARRIGWRFREVELAESSRSSGILDQPCGNWLMANEWVPTRVIQLWYQKCFFFSTRILY